MTPVKLTQRECEKGLCRYTAKVCAIPVLPGTPLCGAAYGPHSGGISAT